MHLEIISPEEKDFEGEVAGIKVPGSSGSFEMLNEHASILSTLTRGIVRIRTKDGSQQSFQINGGVVEMNNNKAVILAESIQ